MNNHFVLDYVGFVNSYQQNMNHMLHIYQSMENNFNTLIQNGAYSIPRQHNTQPENYRERRNRRDIFHRRETNVPRPRILRRPIRMPHTLFGNNINNLMNNLNAHTNTLSDDFFLSVPIVPTSQQITRATELVSFGNTDNTIQTTCPIDLSPFQPHEEVLRILHCGHFFRPNNLQSLVSHKHTMPCLSLRHSFL